MTHDPMIGSAKRNATLYGGTEPEGVFSEAGLRSNG